jgi:hypothetical protein
VGSFQLDRVPCIEDSEARADGDASIEAIQKGVGIPEGASDVVAIFELDPGGAAGIRKTGQDGGTAVKHGTTEEDGACPRPALMVLPRVLEVPAPESEAGRMSGASCHLRAAVEVVSRYFHASDHSCMY